MGANAPGELIHAITTAVLASFTVTWVLLAGYRRAVARTMRTASAQAERAPSIELPVASPAPIARFLLKQAGLKRTTADTGAVTLIHRFGSAANLNIHLHCLVLDGVYRSSGERSPVSALELSSTNSR